MYIYTVHKVPHKEDVLAGCMYMLYSQDTFRLSYDDGEIVMVTVNVCVIDFRAVL